MLLKRSVARDDDFLTNAGIIIYFKINLLVNTGRGGSLPIQLLPFNHIHRRVVRIMPPGVTGRLVTEPLAEGCPGLAEIPAVALNSWRSKQYAVCISYVIALAVIHTPIVGAIWGCGVGHVI
jgi:hypothetical protein